MICRGNIDVCLSKDDIPPTTISLFNTIRHSLKEVYIQPGLIVRRFYINIRYINFYLSSRGNLIFLSCMQKIPNIKFITDMVTLIHFNFPHLSAQLTLSSLF